MDFAAETSSDDLTTYAGIAGAAILAVILIAWCVNAIRRKLTLRRLRRPVSILFLGPQASGKTVLLTVMHWSMQFRDHHGVRFDAQDPKLSNELHTRLRHLRNPSVPLPSGTKDRPESLRHWLLAASVRVGDQARPVVTFATADYPGELLDQVLDPNQFDQDVVQQMATTDVTFGLIDGHDLRLALERGADYAQARQRLKVNVGKVVHVMLRNPSVSHLLITKWDELWPAYTLADAVKFLYQFEDFRRFAENERGLRVIPISALGEEFFTRAHGKPEKNPEGDIRPFHEDLPFSMAFLHAAHRRMAGDPVIPEPAQPSLGRRFVDALLVGASIQLNLGILTLQYQLRKETARADGTPRMRRGVENGDNLRTLDDAYSFMFARCLNQIRRFDQKYPEAEVRNFDYGMR